MKKIHLILILGVAVAIAIIVSSFGNLSSYESFESAIDKPGKNVVVVAQLDKAQPLVYDPLVDANSFTFYAVDQNQETYQVKFLGAKPRDFEMSEQLVMTGRMDGDIFVCQKIQMKCPSKYETDQIVEANLDSYKS